MYIDSQTITLRTTLTSSDITTTGVDFALTQGNGLVIEKVVVSTDATGLAGGTNLQLVSDNSNGNPIFFEETVANLGANATVDTGSVVNTNSIIETGKKLTAKATGANCTGTGTIEIVLFCRRLDSNSSIQAV